MAATLDSQLVGTSRGGRVATAVAVAASVLAACTLLGARSPEQRQAAADALAASVAVDVAVTSSTLAATHAVADFGVDDGVRLVLVRIVDGLALSVKLTAAHDLAFAEAPRFCLVGPFSAPDDAGLEDPCWGEPDLGSVAASALPVDGAGHPVLPAGRPVALAAVLGRGDARCDYPPGAWVLEIRVDPLVDGAASGPRYVADAPFPVPLEAPGSDPLPVVERSRYCGLASQVFREQGEPTAGSPAP